MIGILIIARLGSTRLPEKQLLKICDKTIIEWLIERIKEQICEKNIKIVIATSTNIINHKFEFLKDNLVDIFYGSDQNIPLRIFQCINKYNFNKIICLGGDNPLSSINGCNLIIDKLNDYDFVETIGLPIGMNVFGMTQNNIYNSINENIKLNDDLEYCWETIFRNNSLLNLKIKLGDYDMVDSDLRITLDYWEDYLFFKKLYETIDKKIIMMDDDKIISIIRSNNFNDINKILIEKYWENFNNGIKKTFNTNKDYKEFKNL